MRFWCSATAIETCLQKSLQVAGLTPLDVSEITPEHLNDCLFIYTPPHEVLRQIKEKHSTAPSSQELQDLYKLLKNTVASCGRSIASWRLQQLDTTALIQLKNNNIPQLGSHIKPPTIQPLTGLITLKLINEDPSILVTYLDLELNSILLGQAPDSNYLSRLKASTTTDQILLDWWASNLEREASFEEAETNLYRIEQIQRDYDQLIDSREDLRDMVRQGNALTQQLLIQLATLQGPKN